MLAKIQQANKMEIDMGNLAKQKSRSADVKAFAEQVVKDHTDTQAKVTALARAQQIDIDAASDNAVQRQKGEQAMDTHNELKNKKGCGVRPRVPGADGNRPQEQHRSVAAEKASEL